MKYVLVLVLMLVFLSACTVSPCDQEIIGEGDCKAVYQGWQYDKATDSCVLVKIEGCSFERPFTSQDDCVTACVQ